jgi:hypothetical protein
MKKKLATLKVGPAAQGMAISPDGRWGLAVSEPASALATARPHTRLADPVLGWNPRTPYDAAPALRSCRHRQRTNAG